jgi:hypothetical protein
LVLSLPTIPTGFAERVPQYSSGSHFASTEGWYLVELGAQNWFGTPDWDKCFLQIDEFMTLRVWASEEDAIQARRILAWLHQGSLVFFVRTGPRRTGSVSELSGRGALRDRSQGERLLQSQRQQCSSAVFHYFQQQGTSRGVHVWRSSRRVQGFFLPVRILKIAATLSEAEQLERFRRHLLKVVPLHTSII